MTDEQEEQLLRGLLMRALERLSNVEATIGGLQQFQRMVEPKIEHNTRELINLQSQRTTYGQVVWLAAVVIAAIAGAFSGHLFDIYWKN